MGSFRQTVGGEGATEKGYFIKIAPHSCLVLHLLSSGDFCASAESWLSQIWSCHVKVNYLSGMTEVEHYSFHLSGTGTFVNALCTLIQMGCGFPLRPSNWRWSLSLHTPHILHHTCILNSILSNIICDQSHRKSSNNVLINLVASAVNPPAGNLEMILPIISSFKCCNKRPWWGF